MKNVAVEQAFDSAHRRVFLRVKRIRGEEGVPRAVALTLSSFSEMAGGTQLPSQDDLGSPSVVLFKLRTAETGISTGSPGNPPRSNLHVDPRANAKSQRSEAQDDALSDIMARLRISGGSAMCGPQGHTCGGAKFASRVAASDGGAERRRKIAVRDRHAMRCKALHQSRGGSIIIDAEKSSSIIDARGDANQWDVYEAVTPTEGATSCHPIPAPSGQPNRSESKDEADDRRQIHAALRATAMSKRDAYLVVDSRTTRSSSSGSMASEFKLGNSGDQGESMDHRDSLHMVTLEEASTARMQMWSDAALSAIVCDTDCDAEIGISGFDGSEDTYEMHRRLHRFWAARRLIDDDDDTSPLQQKKVSSGFLTRRQRRGQLCPVAFPYAGDDRDSNAEHASGNDYPTSDEGGADDYYDPDMDKEYTQANPIQKRTTSRPWDEDGAVGSADDGGVEMDDGPDDEEMARHPDFIEGHHAAQLATRGGFYPSSSDLDDFYDAHTDDDVDVNDTFAAAHPRRVFKPVSWRRAPGTAAAARGGSDAAATFFKMATEDSPPQQSDKSRQARLKTGAESGDEPEVPVFVDEDLNSYW